MNLITWTIKRLYVKQRNINKELWDAIHANWDNDPNFKHSPYPDTFHHDWLTNSKSKIVRPICNWFLTKKYPYYLPMIRVEYEPIPAKEVKCVWTKEAEAALASTFSLNVSDLLMDFEDPPDLNRIHRTGIYRPGHRPLVYDGNTPMVDYNQGGHGNGKNKNVDQRELYRKREEGYWNWFEKTFCNKDKKDNNKKVNQNLYQERRKGSRGRSGRRGCNRNCR